MNTKQQLQENRYELLITIQEAKKKRHIINVLCQNHYNKFGQIWDSLLVFPISFLDKKIEMRQYKKINISQDAIDSEIEIFQHINSYIDKQNYINYLVRQRKKIFKNPWIYTK